MNRDIHRIIKTLDNSPRILFWDMDEFLVMVLPMLVGIGCGSVSMMLLGFAAKPLYRRYKSRNRNGVLQHRIYWIFPHSSLKQSGLIKKLPASHQRDYVL